MPLLGADGVMGMIRNFRVVWIGGRYGGGKSALAHEIAANLLESGVVKYLVSNVRSVWRDDPSKVQMVDGVLVNAVVILDEGGMFLQSGRDVDAYLAFMRKMNIILIIPSVHPPPMRVRFLTITRFMTLTAVGLPAWLYSLTLQYAGVKEQMRFLWWKPSLIYGIYDTTGAPVDDGGLDEYLKEWSQNLQKHTNSISRRARKVSELSQGANQGRSGISLEPEPPELPAVANGGGDAEIIREAAEEISTAFSLFGQQALSKRGR